jgi:hypothetical protein
MEPTSLGFTGGVGASGATGGGGGGGATVGGGGGGGGGSLCPIKSTAKTIHINKTILVNKGFFHWCAGGKL